MSNHLSFSTAILLLVVIVSHSFLHNSITCHASFSHDNNNNNNNNRETLEIVIGGGGYITPAEPPDCPPPPPPPCPPPPPPPRLPPPPPPPPLPQPPKRVPPPSPTPRNHPPSSPTSPISEDPNTLATSERRLVRKIFKDFGSAVQYDPNHFKQSWNGNNPCNYNGVYCDKFNKKRTVIGIKFNGARFNGYGGKPLDLNAFTQIPNLMFFHANSNNFTGVPTNISKIPYLFELDLSNNKLNGTFPKDLLKANSISFLDLRYNNLNGTVPAEAFELYLDVLFLNNNQFTGDIPKNLGKVRALYLTFANNFFTGSIPSSIGNCTETLAEVLFLNNYLSGCLPYEIGKLKKLRVFDASKNQLTGPIPHSFGCLENMQLLNLAQNEFYGPVPEMVCKLSNLQNLTLNNNYFTQVGPECMNLIKKKMLDVDMNCILGLPKQRTPYQCATFFSKHKTCPNEGSLHLIPCTIKTAETSLYDVPRPAMAPSPTYAALDLHH